MVEARPWKSFLSDVVLDYAMQQVPYRQDPSAISQTTFSYCIPAACPTGRNSSYHHLVPSSLICKAVPPRKHFPTYQHDFQFLFHIRRAPQPNKRSFRRGKLS